MEERAAQIRIGGLKLRPPLPIAVRQSIGNKRSHLHRRCGSVKVGIHDIRIAFQHAPRPVRMAGMVSSSNRKSHKTERRLMYCMSRRIQFRKVTLDRPRTCHRQVNPGMTSKRRRCHASYCMTSLCNGGRGPTNDMSPFSTFHICGNSSTLYFRRNLPGKVTRGSFAILKTGPPVRSSGEGGLGVVPHRRPWSGTCTS